MSFEWDSYSNGECQISSVKKLSREKCELSKAEKDIPVNLWVGKRHGEGEWEEGGCKEARNHLLRYSCYMI